MGINMNIKTPFGSEKVITQHVSEADLKTYFVGFDLGKYRYDELVDSILDAIVDFAFGFHEGNKTTEYSRRKLREAAKSIYNIKEFKKIKKIYVDENSEIGDDDESNKNLKRGEFGELILHLLLRDFHKTIPLIAKIYFKDSDGAPVHGFDAVHIQPDEKSLWLGESKLYNDGKKGVEALVKDIEAHFNKNYLRRHFALIAKKRHSYENPDDILDKDYWFDLIDETNTLENILGAVTIPLLCVYSSNTFTNHNTEKTEEFIKDYEREIKKLKQHYDAKKLQPINTSLNIILLLFPVPSKKELVKRLHTKLYHTQQI